MYPCIDVLLTLRCNATCPNCVRGCNAADVTGLAWDTSSDMSEGQMLALIADLRSIQFLTGQPATCQLNLSGGEPTLHPRLAEFVRLLEPLLQDNVIGRLTIGTNGLIPPPPGCDQYAMTATPLAEKHRHHYAIYNSPWPALRDVSWHSCIMPHRFVPVVSRYGCSLCCYGDHLVRLFRREDLLLRTLPHDVSKFALTSYKEICRRCVFSQPDPSMESVIGRPVAPIFLAEALINRQIGPPTTRYHGAP